jgi:hypothetical protein
MAPTRWTIPVLSPEGELRLVIRKPVTINLGGSRLVAIEVFFCTSYAAISPGGTRLSNEHD